VQAFPSSQAESSGLAGSEHSRVEVSQVPATWHWSDAVHTTGFVPVHTPDLHRSACVQAFPSSHEESSGLAGFEHCPVEVLQVPATWHWSDSVHTTGFVPVQTPDLHRSA